MPGLIVFKRRWSVGSDDLVVPGAFLLILHFICFVIVLVSAIAFEYDTGILSVKLLLYLLLGYVLILFLTICVESGICIISMRGSILDTDARTTINFWIYFKSMVMLFDITWLILASIWLNNYYMVAPTDAKTVFIAIVICNWVLVFVTIVTIWCTFDAAGRSWVQMKKYQRSMRETESRFNYKRSGSMNRNWRQRKVLRAYQDSWDHRCRLLFCCISSSERSRNSFTDIARLLSDFFRELDVVPSDVVAGLVLLRKFQKLEREAVVRQRKNGTYEFLSGVPVTDRTQFLALNDAKNYDFFQTVIHYMYFAHGAYGWPMYLVMNRSKVYHLLPELKCFACCCRRSTDSVEVIKDNCCYCNYAALKKTLQVGDIEITYVTYHVDVGETPFFVAIDYTQKTIVVSIRGTLSMKDILTDLNAEGEVLPLDPPRDDWLGHKGMVQAALYIRQKLQEENLIEKALNHNPDRGTHNFDLVLVGHSLGAGTAAILAILMKPEYPSLQCFSYSPPGGLLSMPAVEYSKSFITSVVLGKDVVPRIGLHQMEALRADLINAIQRSVDPKWKTISCSVICCGCGPEPTSVMEMSSKDTHINQYQEERGTARTTSAHPTDSTIALTLHQPLYPPGRIIHIVRHHPKPDENVLKSREPVYQAIWADTVDFDEVLISPVMLQDHMPDTVLAALKKVVTTSGPRKPLRQTSNAFSTMSSDLNPSDVDLEVAAIALGQHQHNHHTHHPHHDSDARQEAVVCRTPHSASHTNISGNSIVLTPTAQHKVCLETSFTNLQSPLDAVNWPAGSTGPSSSKTSSIAGSIFGRSQLSSTTQYDISSVIDDSITTVTRRSPTSLASETATVIVNELESSAVPIHRLKAVAFDMELSGCTALVGPGGRSPLAPPRSILHRQHSARGTERQKPKHLPIPPLRRASDASKPLDLLHDDWFGLAPLASPETLSEISSISSRTSAPMSLANSIERYLHTMNLNGCAANNIVENGHAVAAPRLEDIYESQLHTPKIMRRAPKFTENLAGCAEDTRNLDQYKRMGRVFVTFPRIFPHQGSVDSSDDSFESAHATGVAVSGQQSLLPPRQNSKSADPLDEDSGSQQRELPTTKKLTFSDSQILNDDCASPDCPSCPCRSVGGAGKLDCCRRDEHMQCALSTGGTSSANTGSIDTTYYSANSSLEQFATPGRYPMQSLQQNGNRSPRPTSAEFVLRPGVLESHFPVYALEEGQPLAPAPPMQRDVVGGRVRKRLSSEEFIFTRAEDLPHLVQMTDGGSPAQRKRKHCVYPAAQHNMRFAAASPSKLSSQSSESSV